MKMKDGNIYILFSIIFFMCRRFICGVGVVRYCYDVVSWGRVYIKIVVLCIVSVWKVIFEFKF